MNQKLIGSHAVAQLVDVEFDRREVRMARWRAGLLRFFLGDYLDCDRCGLTCSDEFPNSCACECHPFVAPDLSGPIELDGSGVPAIPMDIDERRWLGHNPYD